MGDSAKNQWDTDKFQMDHNRQLLKMVLEMVERMRASQEEFKKIGGNKEFPDVDIAEYEVDEMIKNYKNLLMVY